MIRNLLLSFGLLVLLAGCSLRRPAATQTPDRPTPRASATVSAADAGMETPTETMTEGPTASPTEAMHAPSMDPAPQAVESMSHEHLLAGPHIQLTETRTPTAEDTRRAEEFASTARQALAGYRDYRLALKDGYTVFAPDVPQDVYHFINYRQVLANLDSFDPARPTALLYKKVEEGWEFVSAMYSAPWGSTEEELDARYPLSMAQWHAHVNICVPRDLQDLESLADDNRFGFEGSIDTRQACSAAGGRFFPDVLGWMVHVNLSGD